MNFDFELTTLWALVWRATWQAFVLAGIIFFLTSTMHRWISPKWRALLWAIPLTRLAVLLIPASGLSLFHFLEFEKRNSTPAAAVSSFESTAIGFTSRPDSLQSDHRNPNTAMAQEYHASNTPVILPQESQTSVPISRSGILAFLWLTGCCVLLCRWIGSKIILARIIKNSELLRDIGLLKLIEERQKRDRLWFPVHCFVTDAHIGPSTCGFWRPTILLPQNLWSDFGEEERQAIVNHELEHIRRCDVLLLLISRIAITIHWFNPLAYLISHRMRREIEQAVDSATVKNFDEQARHAYGELLIRLARQTQGPVAALPMAGKRSALRARINQLANPVRESRTRSAFAICVLLIFIVTGLSDVARTEEQPESNKKSPAVSTRPEQPPESKPQDQYFVTGTVRDARTGKPVSDAEIRMFVASEPVVNQRERKGITNDKGQYRIEVPLGNVQIWFPTLKPGYWLLPEECTQALVTTAENPVLEHNIKAQSGPIWNIHWKGKLNEQQLKFLTAHLKDQPIQYRVSLGEVEDDAKRDAWLKGEPVSFQKAYASSVSNLDQSGRGKLTQVGTSGKYILTLVNMTAELIVETGFDNTRVVSLKQIPDTEKTVMIDASGKKATVSKATVTLTDGVPLLTFQTVAAKPAGYQRLTGRVVDEKGNPLANVRVGVIEGLKGGGSGETGQETKTTDDGTFSIKLPIYDNQVFNNQQFSVMLTKDGFAGMDSEIVEAKKDFSPINFKTLTLQPGHTLSIRVLDEKEQPLAGAILEPGNDYALRRQITRTDSAGRGLLKNLPSGVVQVSVHWGTKIKWTNLVISKNQSKNQEVTIHVNEFVPATTSKVEKSKPLAVGQIAPEWDIAEWSDGQTRKLSDFRGQVVVLDFWGLRCSGCVASIPAQKRLAQKYRAQGVIFLGIHTADGEMSQIKKLKQSEQWTIPTGIDQGTSILDSETGKKYGVQGYPALIVINPEGQITFRSDVNPPGDREAFMKTLAEASGVKWPPAENATQAEMIEIMNQLQFTILSQEIDRVLKTKK
ncbi:M56 family metallopeptidase [Gimesia algae]|uniref:Regulatory protein BlaR1 n=1 Tax=Gimesia algae TaxID=2527971 RepID=A0A517V8X1_9PLAN|nr:M56 family metallopeptidase [Gimesia algae]QDT89450.1 Regulatory protein BlaR1 [Gimesia algae]